MDDARTGRRTPAPAPWGAGPMEPLDKVIVYGVLAAAVYGLAFLPLFPLLAADHPALLELLRGSTPAIVNMGARARVGDTSFVEAVLLGVPSVMMFDWVFWLAGRRWGERVFTWLLGGDTPRARRRLRRVKWLERRFGALAVVLANVLPVPAAVVYAAVGDGGMRLSVFLVLDVLGTVLWTGLLATLGFQLGKGAVDVTDKIDAYSLYATLALVVGIFAYQLVRARRA